MEKRSYQRFDIDLPMNCKIIGSFKPVLARVVNIGPEGVCFTSDVNLEIGQQLELEINLGGSGNVTITADVVWSRESAGTKGYKNGVKITDASREDEKKFIRFYCEQVLIVPKRHGKGKILIVEDEKDMVELLRIELEQEDYQVIWAYDGEEGFLRYSTERPDLVILDLNLPKLNGFEVCRKIRREVGDEMTPILMLTARTGETDKIIGKVIGAEEYITKPFEIEDLLQSIKKLLNRK